MQQAVGTRLREKYENQMEVSRRAMEESRREVENYRLELYQLQHDLDADTEI